VRCVDNLLFDSASVFDIFSKIVKYFEGILRGNTILSD